MAAYQGATRIYQNKTLANNPQVSILKQRLRVATLYEELSRRVPGTTTSPTMLAAALLLQTEDADRQRELKDLKTKDADEIAAAIRQTNAYRRVAYNPAASTYRADQPLAQKRNVLNHMEKLLKTEPASNGHARPASTEKTLGLDSLLLAMADKLATMENSSPDIQQYLRREFHEILVPLCSRMGQPALADFLDNRSFFLADPRNYRRIAREIEQATHMRSVYRKLYLEKMRAGMEEFLKKEGYPNARVTARGKSPASVNRKTQLKSKEYPATSILKDLLGFQIILGTRDIQARDRAVNLIVTEFFKAEKLVDKQTELKHKALKGYDAFYITPLKNIAPEFRAASSDDTPVPHEIQFFPDEAELYDYYYGPGAHAIYKISDETHQSRDFTPIEIKADDPYGNFQRLKDSLQPWTYYAIPAWEGTERTYIDQRIPCVKDNRGRITKGNVADVAALNNKLDKQLAGASIHQVSFDSDQPVEQRWTYAPTQIRAPDKPIADGDVIAISKGHTITPLVNAEGSSSLLRTPVLIHNILHGAYLGAQAMGRKALPIHLKKFIHFVPLKSTGRRNGKKREVVIGAFEPDNKTYREEVLKPVMAAHFLANEQELFTLLGLPMAQRRGFDLWDKIVDETGKNGLRVLDSHTIPLAKLLAGNPEDPHREELLGIIQEAAKALGIADLTSFALLAGMHKIPENALNSLSARIASRMNSYHMAPPAMAAPTAETPAPGFLKGRFGELKQKGTLYVSIQNASDLDVKDLEENIVQILSRLDVEFVGDDFISTEKSVETNDLIIPANLNLQRIADELSSRLNENYPPLESLRQDSGRNFQCMVSVNKEELYISRLTGQERLRGRWIGAAAGFLAAAVSVGMAFGTAALLPAALLGAWAGYRLIPILSEFWHERGGHAWRAGQLGYREIKVTEDEADGWVVQGVKPDSPAGTPARIIDDERVRSAGPIASGIGAVMGVLGTVISWHWISLLLQSPPEQALSNALLLASASILCTFLAAFTASSSVFSFADRSMTNTASKPSPLHPKIGWVDKDGRKSLVMAMREDFPGILWQVLRSLQEHGVDVESLRQRKAAAGGVRVELGFSEHETTNTLGPLAAALRRLEISRVARKVTGGYFLVRARLHTRRGTVQALGELSGLLAQKDINIESIRVAAHPDEATAELVVGVPKEVPLDDLLDILRKSPIIVPETSEVIQLDMNEATARRAQTILREALDEMPGWSPGKSKLEKWEDIPRQKPRPNGHKVDEVFIANLQAAIRLTQVFHTVQDTLNDPTRSSTFWPAAMPQFRKNDPTLAYLTHSLETAYNRVVKGERNPITVLGCVLHDSAEDAGKQVWKWISPESSEGEAPLSLEVLRERALMSFSQVLYNPQNPAEQPDWLADFRAAVAVAGDADALREMVLKKTVEILELRIHQNISACPEVVIEDMHRLTLDRRSQYEENFKNMAESEVRRIDRMKLEEQLHNLRTLFYGDSAFDRKIVAKSLRNVPLLMMRDLSDPDPDVYDNGYRNLRKRYLLELVKAIPQLAGQEQAKGEPFWLNLKDFVQEKGDRTPEKEDLSYTAARSLKAISDLYNWVGSDPLARENLTRNQIWHFQKQLADLHRQLKREAPRRDWFRPLRNLSATLWTTARPYLIRAKEGRHLWMAERLGMTLLGCWVDPNVLRGQVTVIPGTRWKALLFLIADPLGDLVMTLAILGSAYGGVPHILAPVLQAAALTVALPLAALFALSGTVGSSEDWSQIRHFRSIDPTKPLIGHASDNIFRQAFLETEQGNTINRKAWFNLVRELTNTDRSGQDLSRSQVIAPRLQDQNSFPSVIQGEYGVARAQDGVDAVKTIGAWPCIVLTIYDARNQIGMIAHMDEGNTMYPASYRSMRETFIREGGDPNYASIKITGSNHAVSQLLAASIRDALEQNWPKEHEQSLLSIETDLQPAIRHVALDLRTGIRYELTEIQTDGPDAMARQERVMAYQGGTRALAEFSLRGKSIPHISPDKLTTSLEVRLKGAV